MPSNQEIRRMAKEARAIFDKTANLVKAEAKLGAKATDPRKPLGQRFAPPNVALKAIGLSHEQSSSRGKGKRLKNAATETRLAEQVQENVTKLWAAIYGSPDSVKKAVNLGYLKEVEQATWVAAYTSQMLRKGKAPAPAPKLLGKLRGMKGPSKERVRLAAAWVVTLACLDPRSLDKRVKDVAISAYPLLSAGVALNEVISPERAINVAYGALGVA